MYKKIKYFGGLNALRFFAACLVVIHHAEKIRLKSGLFHLKDFSLSNNGGLAVRFFFVLSGFLISYLLLKEQTNTHTISIKKFYIRRILRIWPLYFLLVIIGTLLIPLVLNTINYPYEMPYNFKDVILYYILFSPFMVNLLYGHHLLEPLWSIGVEELFYIIWAPLFKWFKNHILFISVFVIIVRFILLISIIIFPLPHHLDQLIRLLQFEAMAIGALTAYMIFNSEKKIETYMIFSNPVQSCLILYLVISLFGREYLSNNFLFFNYLYTTEIVSTTVMNCVFAWLIVNVSLNGRSIIKLDNRILNFLGDISYGIYMYHMLIIFGIVLIFKNALASMTNLLGTIVFYLIVMAGTLLVSSFSKMMFENYFLKFKTRFRTSL